MAQRLRRRGLAADRSRDHLVRIGLVAAGDLLLGRQGAHERLRLVGIVKVDVVVGPEPAALATFAAACVLPGVQPFSPAMICVRPSSSRPVYLSVQSSYRRAFQPASGERRTSFAGRPGRCSTRGRQAGVILLRSLVVLDVEGMLLPMPIGAFWGSVNVSVRLGRARRRRRVGGIDRRARRLVRCKRSPLTSARAEESGRQPASLYCAMFAPSEPDIWKCPMAALTNAVRPN